MCGASLQQSIQRERRRVSVLFIDLAGFTTLTHGFDPEKLRDLADEVLTVIAGIIETHDGHVDAFRGDGLIALFGAPRSRPGDPERAVLAAAASLRAIEAIGKSKQLILTGRAGVATGVVIAGALGSGRTREYTVMGSTVNLAARVESAATPGEVWVSPATFEDTRHRFAYQPSPRVQLNGFPDVQQLWVFERQWATQKTDPYAQLQHVGREQELAALQSAFERVEQRRKVEETWLTGGPGLGKTRLLHEFTTQLTAGASQSPLIVQLSGQPAPKDLWLLLGEQLFGGPGAQDEHTWREAVTERLVELLPGETRWQEQVLLSLGLVRPRSWTRLERRSSNRTLLAWRDLLVAFTRAEERGLVLAVDNPAGSPQLLELLRLLRTADAPLLLLRTSRELPAGSDINPASLVVPVRPLPVQESLELLNQVASPQMRVAIEALVYQAGGVPAYILELGQVLSVSHEGSFSGSLAALLQARLDMLEPAERQLLSYAALTGERCWEPQLLSLLEFNANHELERMLSDNLLLAVTETSIPGMVELRFQSDLLRHAVLRMIPYADRPQLHLRIGTWLEQFVPLTHAELIGDHFRSGGSHDTAYSYYLAAADLASVNGDAAENVFRLFERALTLDLPPELHLQALLAYAQATLDLADWPKAAQLLQRAEEASRSAVVPDASADLQLLQELQAELAGAHAQQRN